ncbi:class I SAM-dependent methyltransferase [bacterium SCSIO 12741]|nr:class I SAM-dependent methyltransferase [bacterium SCSIO 12741]
MAQEKEIYDPEFVEDLFDRMSSSYARMNYITSFGFSERWRRQCIQQLDFSTSEVILDLMCGMGECWPQVLKRSPAHAQLIGIDFSAGMLRFADQAKIKYPNRKIETRRQNIFTNNLPDGSVDIIISGFGLKTFNDQQIQELAEEMHRLLKPGGQFSLIDVSTPHWSALRRPYLFYLKNIIPILGKLFLGNPETYEMLGIYTEKYGNSKQVEKRFTEAGFEVKYLDYFYGCASGIAGCKSR